MAARQQERGRNKGGTGRPSTRQNTPLAEKLARLGSTDEEMANAWTRIGLSIAKNGNSRRNLIVPVALKKARVFQNNMVDRRSSERWAKLTRPSRLLMTDRTTGTDDEGNSPSTPA